MAKYYERVYNWLIESRSCRGNSIADRDAFMLESRQYTERHHIVPVSLGGGDEDANRAILTAREHFLAHWLLTKFKTGDEYIKCLEGLASWLMDRGGERRLTCRQRALAGKANSKASSIRTTERNNILAAQGLLYSQSDKGKYELSKRMTELGANGLHPKQSAEQRKAESERCTGRNKVKKVCEHCGAEGNAGSLGRSHGAKCESLTSYVLATHLATGETRTFKTVVLAKAHFKSNVHSVISGECKHSKGWHFERVMLS